MKKNILFYLPALSIYEDRIKTISEVQTSKIYFVFNINDNNEIVNKLKSKGHSALFISEIIPIKFLRIILQPFLILLFSVYYNCEIIHLTSYVVNPLVAYLFCKIFNKKYFVSLYILYSSRFKLFSKFSFKEKIKSKQIQKMYLYAIHEYLLLPCVDKLIMQASGLANELPFYSRFKEKVYIIKNGISKTNIKWHPRKVNLTNQNIKILFIGGIDYTRGVDKLIHAVTKLNNNGYKIKLNLVGNIGDYFSSFLETVNLKNIKIHKKKKRNELFNFVLEHDIFVYPTLNEGSPRIILELASIGIPIIASKHPGILEIDKYKRFINFINENENIEFMIEKFLSDQEKFFKKAFYGREYVKENNSYYKIAKNYESHYAEKR